MFCFGRPLRWQALRQTGQAIAAAIALGGMAIAGGAAVARESAPATVALAQLPSEAQDTHRSILAGGPFRFEKDGTVFGNRERALPSHARGFYREYTVADARARHRGARRIVCGGREPTAPVACFYTADHYATFSRIVP